MVPEITRHCPGVPFLLVGMKADLIEDRTTIERLAERKQTPVRRHQAQELAEEIKAVKYLECSALSQKGLQTILQEAAIATLVLPSPPDTHTRGCILM